MYVIVILVIFGLIASSILYYSIKIVDHAYSDLRGCRDCIEYDFSSTTIESLSNASKDQVYCYCRYNGWDRVQDNNDRNSDDGGLKSLCDDWTDDYRQVYGSVFIALAVMYIINLLFTYGFKLLFAQNILRFNKKTYRHILVSVSVFVYTIVFLGIMPLYTFDKQHHDIDREWYLITGNLYILYFLLLLIVHPFEGIIYFICSKISTWCIRKKSYLQKDLNKILLGKEYDYSHKIGRLLGHAWIVYFFGAGIPLLFAIFSVHLALFFTLEKFYVLKFYRKMEAISCYFKTYVIYILIFIFLSGCFNGIRIFGNPEIFPTSYNTAIGTRSGKTVTYYNPKSRTFLDKLLLKTGIAYLVIAIICVCLYTRFYKKSLFELVTGTCFPTTKSLDGSLIRYKVSDMISKNQMIEPSSFTFESNPKYSKAIEAIEDMIIERSPYASGKGIANHNHFQWLDSPKSFENDMSEGVMNSLAEKPLKEINIYNSENVFEQEIHSKNSVKKMNLIET